MDLSQAVIDELARCWMRLHRSAAQPHLELMIKQMRRSGDVHGAADYARVLEAVRAKESVSETAAV